MLVYQRVNHGINKCLNIEELTFSRPKPGAIVSVDSQRGIDPMGKRRFFIQKKGTQARNGTKKSHPSIPNMYKYVMS